MSTKKNLLSIFFLIFFFSCEEKKSMNHNGDEVNFEVIDNSEKINNSINGTLTSENYYIIPFDKVYTDYALELVNKGDIYQYSRRMVTDFIFLKNSFIIINNDKQRMEEYSMSKLELSDSIPFTVHDDPEYDSYELSRIYLSTNQDKLFVSSYFFSIEVDLISKTSLIKPDMVFAKNNPKFVRVFDKGELLGLKKISVYEEEIWEETISTGWDVIYDNFSKTNYYFFTQSETKMLYVANRKQTYNLNKTFVDMDIFDDVDIVFLNENIIGFVLKSHEHANDLFILYDFTKKEIYTKLNLSTKTKDEILRGEPICFPTGTIYKIEGNQLWRMGTTKKGLVFESWNIESLINLE